MAEPTVVEDGNFDKLVLKADKPVLVDFWAPWCRPCLMVAPILDELAGEYSGRVTFAKLNVDQNQKTAAKYGVMSIPTLLIFQKGEPVSNMVGLRSKDELKQSLDAALG